MCLYGFKQWSMAHVGVVQSFRTLPNIVVGVAVLLGLLRKYVLKRESRLPLPANTKYLLGLLVLAAISYLWTMSQDAWVVNWVSARSYLYMIVFALLAPLLFTTMDDFYDGLVNVLPFSLVVMILITVFSDFSGDRGIVIYEQEGTGIAQQQQANPLALASMAGVACLLVAILQYQGWRKIWLLLRIPMIALGLFLIVRSGSRGQFVVSVLLGFTLVPLARPIRDLGKFIRTAVLLVLVGIIGYFIFQSLAGGSDRWSFNAMANAYESGRLDRVRDVLGYWFNHITPWSALFGIGNCGAFNPEVHGFYPENVPAEVLAEEGLVGFGLLLAGLFLTFRGILRTFRLVYLQPIQRSILAGLAAMFLFELLLLFKSNQLISSYCMICFAGLIGRYELLVRSEVAEAPSLRNEELTATQGEWEAPALSASSPPTL